MAKIRVQVTYETHRWVEIESNDYTESNSISDICELFASIKESPLSFIDACDDSSKEVGEVTNQSVIVIED